MTDNEPGEAAPPDFAHWEMKFANDDEVEVMAFDDRLVRMQLNCPNYVFMVDMTRADAGQLGAILTAASRPEGTEP